MEKFEFHFHPKYKLNRNDRSILVIFRVVNLLKIKNVNNFVNLVTNGIFQNFM